MKEKMEPTAAIAGFAVLGAILVLEMLLLAKAAPIAPGLSQLARFATRIMFGH